MKNHKNSLMAYSLNENMLKDGDILLFNGGCGVVSMVVKIFTVSRFSHAAIFMKGSVFESTGNGVFTLEPRRIRCDKESDICVLRYRESLTDGQLSSMEAFLRNSIGKSYSILSAASVGFFKHRKPLSSVTSEEFCSRLVAQTYEQAHIKLVNNYNYCSPAAFLRECGNLLLKVEGCVRSYNAIDAYVDSIEDAVSANRDALKVWMDKVKILPGAENVASENDACFFAMKNPRFDAQIARWIDESGYLRMYEIIFNDRNLYKFSQEGVAAYVDLYGPDVIEIEFGEISRTLHWVASFINSLNNWWMTKSEVACQMRDLYYKLSVIMSVRLQNLIKVGEGMGISQVIDGWGQMICLHAFISDVIKMADIGYNMFTSHERGILKL